MNNSLPIEALCERFALLLCRLPMKKVKQATRGALHSADVVMPKEKNHFHHRGLRVSLIAGSTPSPISS